MFEKAESGGFTTCQTDLTLRWAYKLVADGDQPGDAEARFPGPKLPQPDDTEHGAQIYSPHMLC